MPAFVLKNAYVLLGGVDFSDHTREVHVELSADDVDITAMGAGGKTHLAGLRDDKITLSMYSDFSATKIDAVLRPVFYNAGTITCWVAYNGSTAAATNPFFGGTFQLLTYTPIGGAVGDASMTPVELVPYAGQGTISVATS